MKKCFPQFTLAFAAILCLLFSPAANATHMRGGQITLERVGDAQSRTYTIRVRAYIDTESPVPFGGSPSDVLTIYGSSGYNYSINIPEITSNGPQAEFVMIDFQRNVVYVSYALEFTFPDDDFYTISYREINRNAGVVNFTRSVDTPFYIETSILIDGVSGNVISTPSLLERFIFFGQSGEVFQASLGAHHVEDDIELYYRMVTPKSDFQRLVDGYSRPENLYINPFNGMITWDGNFQGNAVTGEYSFATEIISYRDGKIIGRTVCDFQVIMDESENTGTRIFTGEDIDENHRVLMQEEQTTFKILAAYDPMIIDKVSLTTTSAMPDAVSFVTYDSTLTAIKVGVLTVQSAELTVRDVPYVVNFRVRAEVRNHPEKIVEQDFSILLYTRDITPTLPELVDSITSLPEEPAYFIPYPNPVVDFLSLEKGTRAEQLSLTGSNGKRVTFQLMPGPAIDFRTIPCGIYILKMQHQDGSRSTYRISKN